MTAVGRERRVVITVTYSRRRWVAKRDGVVVAIGTFMDVFTAAMGGH